MIKSLLPYLFTVKYKIVNRIFFVLQKTQQLVCLYSFFFATLLMSWLCALGLGYLGLIYLGFKPIFCFLILFAVNILLTTFIYWRIAVKTREITLVFNPRAGS